MAAKKPPLGTGARFKLLVQQLGRQGIVEPAALAAWIGRRKYGSARFNELAAAGRRKGKYDGRR